MTSPSQNLRNPFPRWRLKSGMMKATDEQLEVAAESCEQWTLGGAAVLIVGLLLELGLAACDLPHESFWGRWGTVAGTFLVVVGVGAEVLFGRMGTNRQRELSRRSKDRELEAKAELERVKKKLAPRNLDRDALLAALKGRPKPESSIEILYKDDDAESHMLAHQIWSVLTIGAQWPASPPQPTRWAGGSWPTAEWVGGQMSGVSVVENPPPGMDTTLGGALKVGLFASFGQITWSKVDNLPVGGVRIVVAPKPP